MNSRSEGSPGRQAGGRADAVRNDERILDAARDVFCADPNAPIALVAHRAGVGISALYRRYPSKEALVQRLNADGLAAYIDAAEQALARDDPWDALTTFLTSVVEADSHSLTQRLAGTFTPTEEIVQAATEAHALAVRLVDQAHQANVLRPDIVVDDLSFIFEQIAAVRLRDPERTQQLRRRYLSLQLEALHLTGSQGVLPGPPPGWAEIAERWERSEGS